MGLTFCGAAGPSSGSIIPEERRGFSSRAIVDACKAYERLKTFPKAVQVSDKLRDFVGK